MAKLSSPIIPIPSWYFTDVLTSESRDVARIMWVFIEESLEDGKKDIPASFKDIEMWTGLVPDRISASIKILREKGYLIRIKAGVLNSESGVREKAIYRVNWDFKETGVEHRVREIYGHISQKYTIAEPPKNGVDEEPVALDSQVEKLVKVGDKIRVGRFGDENGTGKSWYRVGYQQVREQQMKGPWGIMIRKITAGQLDDLSVRDILSFYEYKYLKCNNSPYVPVMGKDIGILRRLKVHLTNVQIMRMIRWLFESGQRDYVKPSMGLLGSRLVNDVHEKSVAWEKTLKGVKSYV
jgi:hypothetical protein